MNVLCGWLGKSVTGKPFGVSMGSRIDTMRLVLFLESMKSGITYTIKVKKHLFANQDRLRLIRASWISVFLNFFCREKMAQRKAFPRPLYLPLGLRGCWVYRSYRDRKRNNLINSCRCKKNLHISCVISINQQWILLACIFSFKNTHNSNVSKGKKTGRRSWLLYRRFSCNHSIHSRSISGSLQRSGFQDVCLFVYFLSSVSFAYSRRPSILILIFRFKSVERVGNCVVRSLDVGKRVWQESLVSGAQCGLLVYNL